jgi:nitrite reductase/ring-hydroxylating ferredoxin subunit
VARHIVGTVEEIPPGGRKIVRLEGREVGVFNLGGTFYALKNACPHQAARVCLGRVVGTALPSDVYEYRYGQEGRILRCPWHAWEYDITTGQSVFDPAVRVVTYRVEVDQGQVAVTVE